MRFRWLDGVLIVVVLGVLGLMARTTPSSDRMPDGRVVVTYWEKWTRFEGEAIKHVVERFNEKNNRIYVRLMSVSDIPDKVKVAAAGGNPPDLAGLYNYNVASFAGQRALLPLDDLCREHGITPDRYVPVFWEAGRYRGRLWALPTTPATVALYYNRKMLREAGLPDRAPATIAELDDWAERLTVVSVRVNGTERRCTWPESQKLIRDGRDRVEFVEFIRMGHLPTEPGWFNWAWGAWFGGSVFDPNRGVTATDPGNLAAMEWFVSYAAKYGLSHLLKFQGGFGNFSSSENAFFNGKVAMEQQGVWLPNFINRYAPKDFDWDAAPFPPASPSDQPVTVADTDVIGIPAGARHPREAFEFIRYLQSQEGMELLCLLQWKQSPLAEVSEGFYRRHPNKRIRLFYDMAWSPRAVGLPRTGIWQEYQTALNTAYDNAWGGIQSPRAALAEVQDRMAYRYQGELRQLARLGKRP
jgi:multiple sugar transport system substrate-binding protein